MNKILLAITTVSALTFATFNAADAQQRPGYNRPGQSYGNNYYRGGNRYVQNNYYGGRRGGWNGNGAAWAAGLGGLAVGAIIGGAIASQPAYAAPVYGGPVGVPAPVVPGPGCVQVQISNRLVQGPTGGYYQVPVYGLQCY